MNAERVFTHFSRLSEAPDALPRLRRFIREMAISGTLVHASRARISFPNGEIGSNGGPARPQSDAPPWPLVTVREVGDCRLGKMLDKAKNRGVPRRYLRNVNVRWFDFDLADVKEMRFEDDEAAELALRVGDVLVCEGGEPGRAAVWDGRESGMLFQKAIHRVRLSLDVDPHYFVLALRQAAESGRLVQYFTGATFKHLTGAGLAKFSFPKPPLPDQRRVVGKVDELMAVCDQLEAAQAERERQRDLLATASLETIRTSSSHRKAAPRAVRVALEGMPRFLARSDQVAALRETIRDLAVKGCLVPQDHGDDSGAMLIELCAKAKVELVAHGKIRKQPSIAGANTAQMPFAVPGDWDWARVDDVFYVSGGIQKTPKREPVSNAYPYLAVANVQRGWIDFTNLRQFELFGDELERLRLAAGDLLIVEGNGSASEIGRCARYDGRIPNCVHQNHLIRCRPLVSGIERFTLLYLNSPTGMAAMRNIAVTSAGLFNLSVDRIRRIPVPIPPVREQSRIVAKVDDLLGVSDDLERSLATIEMGRAQLLDAVLHEALSEASPVSQLPNVV